MRPLRVDEAMPSRCFHRGWQSVTLMGMRQIIFSRPRCFRVRTLRGLTLALTASLWVSSTQYAVRAEEPPEPGAEVTPEAFLARVNRYPRAELVDHETSEVIGHVIGLGAIQKVRGQWRLEHQARLSGNLVRYTWRIVDGYSSAELFEEIAEELPAYDSVEVLFRCEGRSCGRSVQWANRIFGQRVLYGTEESQRYRVTAFRTADGADYRLILYASARTADRHYLHAELLRVSGGPASEIQL